MLKNKKAIFILIALFAMQFQSLKGYSDQGCFWDYTTAVGVTYKPLSEPGLSKTVALSYVNNVTTSVSKISGSWFFKPSGSKLDVEYCMDICYANNLLYAGLYGGDYCGCGSSISLCGSSTTTSNCHHSSSFCSTRCPGNSTEKCGYAGDSGSSARMGIFKY